MEIIIALFGVVVLGAWVTAVYLLIELAGNKGEKRTGLLWFVGIFASLLVLGIYVVALPNSEQKEYPSEDLPRL
jgi:general stress protein CsbA